LQIQHFKSSESPIIVTKIKDKKDLAIDEISPNMNTIGAMFPYSGTLKLISKLSNRSSQPAEISTVRPFVLPQKKPSKF
jgi:hydrogenase maturation factor HypF (carbamoyltransferase family)